MRATGYLAWFTALMVIHTEAAAQHYPVRPIRMVVGFAAGGATDLSARFLAQKVSESIGQQVIVDNRPGASSMLAAELVARGAPDGYTLLFANATIAMPSLFAKLPFDVQKDLKPVTLVGYGPLALRCTLPCRSNRSGSSSLSPSADPASSTTLRPEQAASRTSRWRSSSQ